MASELARRVDQVPVVPERQDGLLLQGDFHLTEGHGSSEVLLVKRAQAGGVEILLQDPVLFAEVHGVDLVAVHQVDHRQFGRETLHTGGQSEDGVSRLRQQEVRFGEGKRKWMQLKQSQDGVGGGHWYVQQQQDVLPIVEV